jgi:hypothetical protein
LPEVAKIVHQSRIRRLGRATGAICKHVLTNVFWIISVDLRKRWFGLIAKKAACRIPSKGVRTAQVQKNGAIKH